MSTNDATSNLLITGALVAGAGVVGYLGARWLVPDRAPSRAPLPQRTPFVPPKPAPAPATTKTPLSLPPAAAPTTAPVSSPTQVSTSAPSSARPGALSHRFDPLFDRHRGAIPIEFLRALSTKESAMNPNAKNSAAWGLLQIIEAVRLDFNRAHRTIITRDQLLDPEINVRIATWLLRIILDGFQRHHADVPNLRLDWNNPRFVELLVFAWNAGFSESGGVGRVARFLKAKGARNIDLDLIHQHARAAGASKHLSNPAKVQWSRGVAALYMRERAITSSAAQVA